MDPKGTSVAWLLQVVQAIQLFVANGLSQGMDSRAIDCSVSSNTLLHFVAITASETDASTDDVLTSLTFLASRNPPQSHTHEGIIYLFDLIPATCVLSSLGPGEMNVAFCSISSLTIITLQYQHSSTGAPKIETVCGRHIQYIRSSFSNKISKYIIKSHVHEDTSHTYMYVVTLHHDNYTLPYTLLSIDTTST